MGLALVFKKGLLRFDSLMMQEHNIFLSWTTVSIIQNLRSISSQRDALQKNSLMRMEIRTKRLASNTDTQLMFSHGLSSNWRFFSPTPVSGLPELLFDEGFWASTSFCMQTHSSYTIAVTDSTAEASNKPSHVTPFESQEFANDLSMIHTTMQ